MRKPKTYKLIESKYVFIISLLVIALTVLGVYFWGLGYHHTFFENSIISTTILSLAFLSFVTTGLYRGVKLKDNLGNIIGSFQPINTSEFFANVTSSLPDDLGEGIVGVILSILLWILMAIVFSIALWIFSNVLLLVTLVFVGMLYWVFFRAVRLVFKNSNQSKGNIRESLKWGISYTVLYNFWIYGIFILTNFWKR